MKRWWYIVILMLLLFTGTFYAGFFGVWDHFPSYITGIFLAFTAYFFILKNQHTKSLGLTAVILLALLLRLPGLWAEPLQSDDVYRYAWDGDLIAQGVNPYRDTPQENQHHNPELYEKLNSPNFYSVYPPAAQGVFGFCSLMAKSNVESFIVYFKILLLLADLLLIYLIFQLSDSSVLAGISYAFNPLVILEFSYNAHFEGLMILAILLALRFLLQNKIYLTGILLGCAISLKIIPLLILPFVGMLGTFKTTLKVGLLALLTILVSFIPFWNWINVEHIVESVRLFQSYFEYNGSIYLLLKSMGLELNSSFVQYLLMLTPLILIGTLFLLSRKKIFQNPKSFFLFVSLVFFVRYLFATTVHPWYIIPIFVFGLFAGLKFPMVWTSLIPLSYAYFDPGIPEEIKILLIFLEYSLVLFLFYRDMQTTGIIPSRKKQKKVHSV